MRDFRTVACGIGVLGCLSLSVRAAAPANDNFANAFSMSGVSVTVTGTVVSATRETGEPRVTPNAAHSAWWNWTAPADGVTRVSTIGSESGYNSTLGIYTGNAVNALSVVATNDDSGANSKSLTNFNAVLGTTYRIQVDGFNNTEVGYVMLNLHMTNTPPTCLITNPLNNASFPAGATITINAWASDFATTTINASGVTNVDFYQGATKIGQDTTSPFAFTWSSVPQGNYVLTAVAQNNKGLSTTSSPVAVTVNPNQLPSVNITSPGNGFTFYSPSNVTITASASDPDGTIARVEFFVDGVSIGQDTSSPYSRVWNNTNPGTFTLTAVATDNSGATNTSAPITVTALANQYPNIVLRSPNSGASFVAAPNLTLVAAASDPDGTVTNVAFYRGLTLIGQTTNGTGGDFSIVWSNVAAGSYSLSAVATDNAGAGTTYAGVSLTVTALGANQTNMLPAGAVWKYLDNGIDQGTAWTGTNFNDTSWAAGAAQLGYGDGDEVTTVGFGPDSLNKYITTYFRRAFVVAELNRVTNLVAHVLRDDGVVLHLNGQEWWRNNMPVGPIAYNTFAASSVVASDETTNFVSSGSLPLAPLVAGTNILAVEIHQATANSTDISFDLELIADLGPGTNVFPTVSITSPANNSFFTLPVDITINANASDADGSVSKVEFFQNGSKLGEDTTAPYSFTWTNPPPGNYALRAVATDNLGASNTSATVNISVSNNVAPSVSITLPTNNAGFAAPATITINATASDVGGGTVTNVSFYEGNSKLGEDLTSPYSFVWPNVPAGNYQLTARAADNGGLITTSAVINVSVINNQAPVVSITSPANGASFVTPTNITIVTNPTDPDSGSCTPCAVTKVEFFQNANKIGERSAAPFSLTWTNPSAGVYSLTAVASDNFGAQGTSAPVSIIVQSGTTWVAFNDHAPGTGTHANTTTWNALGDAPGSSGALKNITNGATLPVNLTITRSGNVQAGGTADYPSSGTPAYNTFNGYVDFAGSPNPSVQVPSGALVTYTFTNLDSAKRYSFKGSAVRGGSAAAPANYTNRWTMVTLLGANSFTSAHQAGAGSPGVVTSAQAPADLQANQAAFNFGVNFTGDMADWDNIDPGSDGRIDITCTQYSGLVPGGSSTLNAPPYGYAFNALRLEEVSAVSQFAADITSPADNTTFVVPASPGGPATTNVTINATAVRSGGTITNVAFYQNNIKLADDASSPYNFTWSNVPVGNYALKVVATDNVSATVTSAIVNISVISNAFPTVSISSPTNNSSFTSPASIGINANASDPDGSVTNVDFYATPGGGATQKIGSDNSSPFSFTWNGVGAGSYQLRAVAFDNRGFATTSAVVNVTVAGNAAPTVNITAPTNNSSFSAPTNITITATASDSDGSVSQVQFFANGANIGTDTTNPYSISWTNPVIGTFAVTAVATDNGGMNATSAPVTVQFTGSGPVSLIATGAIWKYFDQGVDLGTAWANRIYTNDASWASGPSELGYGDAAAPDNRPESTVVGFGPDPNNKYPTTYFRHAFLVNDPTAFAALTLNLVRDDGAVVYLNGAEVYRNNMPGGQITYNTPASTTIGGSDEAAWYTTTVSAGFLVGGTNVVAVEIHQFNGTSSDISFNLSLIGNTGAFSNVPPTVAMISPANGSSYTAPATITLTASPSDSDGTVSKVEFYQAGVKLTELSSAPYEHIFGPVSNGTYQFFVVAQDNLGGRGTSAVVTAFVIASTAPTISSIDPAPGVVTNLERITVTFDQPVDGVNASDLLVNYAPASSMIGSNAVYEFRFAPPLEGQVLISWAANHGIVNRLSPPVPFDGEAAGWNYNLQDLTPPRIVSIDPPPGSTLRSLTKIKVTFDEPVGGINAGDLLINDAPARNLSGADAGPYSFSVDDPTNGTVQVSWNAAAGIHDFAGAQNAFAGGSWTYTVDSALTDTVVINEIMYHPMPNIPEDTRLEWIELFNVGSNTVNLTGWKLKKDVDFAFPSNTTLLPGKYLVVAANVATFAGRYPSVANVIGNWTGILGNHGGSIELDDAKGDKVDSVDYATEGDWAVRVRPSVASSGHYGWTWLAEADGLGKSMELRNPLLKNSSGQNWGASTTINGTPGVANSLLSTDVAPLILAVQHQPLVPRSSNTVTVTAQIVDELSTGVTVRLFYRLDANPQNSFSFTNMFDDGAHGDGGANDHFFGVVLPARPNNSVVEFYVQATDATSHVRTWPAAARQTDSSFAQTANCLYQVDDSAYTSSQPLYRVIMTEIERAELADMWSSAPNSDAEMNGTFITIDGVEMEYRYVSSFRHRGHGTRTASPHNIRVSVANEQKWHGVRSINLNTQFTQDQVGGPAVIQKSGLAMADSRAVHVHVNNQDLAAGTPNSDPTYGVYAHNENLASEWATHHFPEDGGGNIYRGVRSDSTGEQADLSYKGEDQNSYRAVYFKESNISQDDFSDLVELTRVLNNTPNGSYYAEVNRVVDVDNWMLYFAANTLLDNSETAISNGNGDDYAMYRPAKDRRFRLLPYDVDSIFGQGQTVGSTTASIFRMNNLAAISRFINWPDFTPRYYAALKHLIETSFSAAQLDPLLDRTLGPFVPQTTINAMKSWQASRNSYVMSQIQTNFSVTTTFVVSNGYNHASSPNTTFAGTADVTRIRYVRFNGSSFASLNAISGAWSGAVPLQPGINHVLIEALGLSGEELVRTNIDVWYDDGTTASVSGTLASSTTWTAAGGPYLVTAALTIPSGVTLTIEPGTTVYFGAGVTMTVSGTGRLLAQGTDNQAGPGPNGHIRFTRQPGSGSNWGSVDFLNASIESRLAYVDFAFCGGTSIGGHTAQVHVNNSVVFIDHCTWPPTPIIEYISFDASSFIVQHCVFPSYPSDNNQESLHGVNGIPVGGYGIFRDNYFGHTWAFNDTIDFTGGNRPGPILQIINNVFDGASDDCLDLDSTDAWIEGNIFMHVHRDPARTDNALDTASAISGGVDTVGQNPDWTIINNIFYDVDHVFLNKGGSTSTGNGGGRVAFLYNTVIHVAKEYSGSTASEIAAFDWSDDNIVAPDPSIGSGMYAAHNIIYDCTTLHRLYSSSNHTVIMDNNILAGSPAPTWSGPGSGNRVIDPMLNLSVLGTTHPTNVTVAQLREAAQLRPGSPALGAGFGGLDIGAQGTARPTMGHGIAIAGPLSLNGIEQSLVTSASTAKFVVGPAGTFNWGTTTPQPWGWTAYKWKLDNGSWSAEIPVTNNSPFTNPPTITLSNLSNGPHTVSVIGKNDAGYYQDNSFVYPPDSGIPGNITVSRTWIVNTNLPSVVINEVLARNDTAVPVGSKHPDLIELYNPGSVPVNLAGMGLSDEASDAYKYTFPAGASIGAGQYLILYGDNDNSPLGYHVGFGLNQSGDDLYLHDDRGQLVDAITFGIQAPDLSMGRQADGTWVLTQPTFGAANVVQALGSATSLKINEWLAHGVSPYPYDFIELYNSDSAPVSLAGLFLSDEPATTPALSQIPALSFIAAHGYTVLIADGDANAGADHVNFKLSTDQGLIGLAAQDTTMIDCVIYGPQRTDISQGRSPNGSINYAYFATPTPGSPNPAPSGTGGRIVLNEVLANNVNTFEGDGTHPDWVELYNPSNAVVNLTDMSLSDDVTKPRRWVFPSGSTIPALGYLLIHFDGSSSSSSSFSSSNAMNTGFGLKDTGGAVYLYDTLAAGGSLIDSVTFGIQAVDFSIGRFPNGSANWVLLSPSPRVANANPPVLGSISNLKVNEWMGTPASGEDWFEIYNGNVTVPVALGGLYLSDDLIQRTKYTIPPLSFLGIGLYGFQRFWADSTPAAGADHTSFKLNNSGESLAISTSAGALIDGVTFGPPTVGVSSGRLPDGSSNIMDFPTSATPGESNFLPLQDVVVNEILSHSTDPLEDAIELHNTTGSDINIGGWYLSDARHYLTKYRIPTNTIIAANGFVVFYEYQFNAIPNDIASFSLNSSRGDQVYLSAAANGALTGYRSVVSFGAAQIGVSMGRYQTSVGVDFVALSGRTFGADSPDSLEEFRGGTGLPNAYPLVGPVVISEIMYRPPDVNGLDNVIDEFIELHNITNVDVALYHPTYTSNVWRLRDAVDFDFPTNTVLGAGAYLLVVSFNPATDASAVAEFRSRYNLSPSVAIFGPYQGKLNNASDSVELYKPDAPQQAPDPDAGYVPYILVDRVAYSDLPPWPPTADGTGNSLQRVNDFDYGNDPANWIATVPTPGPAAASDRDNDGMPDQWEIDHNLNPDDSSDALGDADHDGLKNRDEYRAGTDPWDPNSNLKITITGVNPMRFQFTAQPYKSYSVEHRSTLSNDPDANWDVLINIAPSATAQVIPITHNPGTGAHFYRVRTPQR